MISVIICTYNRSGKLRNALNRLQETRDMDNIQWEVIVVDNNSTDDTRAVSQEFRRLSRLPLRYVFERKQGISYARNHGIRAAVGNTIVFTDDDCIVDRDWLAAIHREFSSEPSLSVLGGRVELYNSNDRPVTLQRSKQRTLFTSPAQLFALIPGCNMAFRRTVFDRIGDFDARLGLGTTIPAAEDSDFIYRAYKAGFRIAYSPDVLVYHDHGRNTDVQVRELERGYAIGRGAFYCKHILAGDRAILRHAYWELRNALRRAFKDLAAPRAAADQLRFLRYLVLGAALWLKIRFDVPTAKSDLET